MDVCYPSLPVNSFLAADRATGTGLSLETDLIAVISVWLLLKVFWVATSIVPSVLTSPHLAALWQVLTSEVLTLLCLTKTDPREEGRNEPPAEPRSTGRLGNTRADYIIRKEGRKEEGRSERWKGNKPHLGVCLRAAVLSHGDPCPSEQLPPQIDYPGVGAAPATHHTNHSCCFSLKGAGGLRWRSARRGSAPGPGQGRDGARGQGTGVGGVQMDRLGQARRVMARFHRRVRVGSVRYGSRFHCQKVGVTRTEPH